MYGSGSSGGAYSSGRSGDVVKIDELSDICQHTNFTIYQYINFVLDSDIRSVAGIMSAADIIQPLQYGRQMPSFKSQRGLFFLTEMLL